LAPVDVSSGHIDTFATFLAFAHEKIFEVGSSVRIEILGTRDRLPVTDYVTAEIDCLIRGGVHFTFPDWVALGPIRRAIADFAFGWKWTGSGANGSGLHVPGGQLDQGAAAWALIHVRNDAIPK
jgi:hypothetical protein